MKSTSKAKGSKLISSKPMSDMPDSSKTGVSLGLGIVGPGLSPPLKDYKKSGAT